MDGGEHLLVAIPGILEIEHHGVTDQQGVLGQPRLRPHAEDVVLEGSRAQRAQAGVDAGGVRVDQRPLLGRQQRQCLPGQGPKTVDSRLAVDRNRRRTEKLGEFTGGPASQEVHLEEAVLRMDVAECARDVPTGVAADRRHSGAIAINRDCGGETRQCCGAVDLGQGAAREPPESAGSNKEGEQQHAQDTREQTKADGGGV